MSDADRIYYERKARQEERHNKAVNKAKKRGEVAAEWFKTNKLTPDTKKEFDKLMKDTDMAFNGA